MAGWDWQLNLGEFGPVKLIINDLDTKKLLLIDELLLSSRLRFLFKTFKVLLNYNFCCLNLFITSFKCHHFYGKGMTARFYLWRSYWSRRRSHERRLLWQMHLKISMLRKMQAFGRNSSSIGSVQFWSTQESIRSTLTSWARLNLVTMSENKKLNWRSVGRNTKHQIKRTSFTGL